MSTKQECSFTPPTYDATPLVDGGGHLYLIAKLYRGDQVVLTIGDVIEDGSVPILIAKFYAGVEISKVEDILAARETK